jgi:hypothetical protein
MDSFPKLQQEPSPATAELTAVSTDPERVGHAATAPAISTRESPASPTTSACSNLSIPLKSSGQVVSPGPVTRFTAGCVSQVLDMFRRLDERAKAAAQTSAAVSDSEARENHGTDGAGRPADPGPLGPPATHREAPEDHDEGRRER